MAYFQNGRESQINKKAKMSTKKCLLGYFQRPFEEEYRLTVDTIVSGWGSFTPSCSQLTEIVSYPFKIVGIMCCGSSGILELVIEICLTSEIPPKKIDLFSNHYYPSGFVLVEYEASTVPEAMENDQTKRLQLGNNSFLISVANMLKGYFKGNGFGMKLNTGVMFLVCNSTPRPSLYEKPFRRDPRVLNFPFQHQYQIEMADDEERNFLKPKKYDSKTMFMNNPEYAIHNYKTTKLPTMNSKKKKMPCLPGGQQSILPFLKPLSQPLQQTTENYSLQPRGQNLSRGMKGVITDNSKENMEVRSTMRSDEETDTSSNTVCAVSASEKARKMIEDTFARNVKGEAFNSENRAHHGEDGHRIEDRFGVKRNATNGPDVHGYELKKQGRNKTTLGDFSASEYAFSKNQKHLDPNLPPMTRSDFFKNFGHKNPKKNDRGSYSGSCTPTYVGKTSRRGQTLRILENGDLAVFYNHSADTDINKSNIHPFFKTGEDIMIIIWKAAKLREKVENKFNRNGFAMVIPDSDNRCSALKIGRPFTYEEFLGFLRAGHIFFDSGMVDGNSRNYSHFRGTQKGFWGKLIVNEK